MDTGPDPSNGPGPHPDPSKSAEPGPLAAAFEGELGDALRRTGDDFTADTRALTNGGLARGRALKRRRTAAVVGGAAALAAVVAGGAVLTGAIGTGPEKRPVAGPGPHRGASGKAVGGPGGTVTDEGMVDLLKEALPKGKTSGGQGRGFGPKDADKSAYAQVVYDDGKGAAAVDVVIGSQGDYRCPDPTQVPDTQCTRTELGAGSALVSSKGYEYPDQHGGIKMWQVTFVTKEGRYVTASEWNAPAEKGEPITRENPPLDMERMADLVRDARWAPVLAAVPRARPVTGPGAMDVKAIFRRLLPKGPAYGEVAADGEYAHVTADDGKGKSLVQINVQPNMLDAEKDLFRDVEVTALPDGTKFAVRKAPGEKGGAGVVMWTVDTVRMDGLRVVVSAFNSGSQASAATRTDPALTIAQLKSIALAEDWRRGR
ncbi:hypothetical protein AB0I22_10540 [Streptomyces sp. NPDC050610]|uniref:hypothetical protein n=1 Tax=Streptomyces sp. NPDC050610 TaxID=3157097 RepID=UPI003426C172